MSALHNHGLFPRPTLLLPPAPSSLPEGWRRYVRDVQEATPGDFSNCARTAILNHCLHDNGKKYTLYAAVIMPDHVHLLLTPLPDQTGWPFSLPSILKSLKGTSARSVNKAMGTEGPVWQEESFDHVLRSDESMAQKLEYIRQNPVRKGLVSTPENYPWLWINATRQK